MSDAELYSKLLSGLRTAEQELVRSIGERTGISNFDSLIGAILFNAGVLELRRLASDYLVSRGQEGAIAAFAKAAQGADIEELRMFIDENEGQADDVVSPPPRSRGSDNGRASAPPERRTVALRLAGGDRACPVAPMVGY